MSEYKIEPHYQKQADELVDWMFDHRILADDLQAEAIAHIKEFIGFHFQSKVNMAIRCHDVVRKIKERRGG